MHLMKGSREIVCALQIHPKLGGVLEVSGQKKCSLRRDPSLSPYQLIHPVQRYGERSR